MPPCRQFLVLLLTGILVSGPSCTPIAALRETRARLTDSTKVDVRIKSANESLEEANRCAKKDPQRAIQRCLSVLKDSQDRLQRDPGDQEALRVYNYALQRVFAVIRMHKMDPWSQPAQFGDFTLSHFKDPRPNLNPSLYEFLPDDQLEVGGKYLKERVTREGLGATLVAISKSSDLDPGEAITMGARVYYGVTAVARFKGNTCEIQFYDPLDTDDLKVAGHTFDLAADYTTPIAVLLTREKPERLGLRRLIDPGRYADTARLIRMRPYDPQRVPLVLVHGLMDTPATWTPMLNALRADPVIRKKYQVWMYSYPSGYPYPYSAELLRQEFDKAAKTYPNHKPMVYVGHSMGGVIGRLMLIDTGNTVWNKSFRVPPEKTHLSKENRELLANTLIFSHRTDIDRAIFISAPHRGSKLAMGWVGRLGSRLVKAPANLVALAGTITDVLLLDETSLQLGRLPNSIDTLSPANPFVKATMDLPITPGVPYHTICGNRGRGGPPTCSDGVVPYTSSHLDGAESELIVPSNHGAHQNPQGIQEVRRILRKHVGAPPAPTPPQTGEAGSSLRQVSR